jgi:hypothetical protein
LFSFQWNTFFFGLITLSLPMFIQVAVAGILFLIGLMVQPMVSAFIAAAGLVFAGTVLWTLQLSGHPQLVSKALTGLPAFIGRQAIALLKMGNPNKNFKHTEHKKFISVDEILGSEKEDNHKN